MIWKARDSSSISRRNAEDRCKVKSMLDRVTIFRPWLHDTIFVCPTEGDQSDCDEGGEGDGIVVAVTVSPFAIFGKTWKIYLCDAFFQMPARMRCYHTGEGISPNEGLIRQDQGGIMLHEMMHLDNLFETLPWMPGKVSDGSYCYQPSQVTGQIANKGLLCGDLLLVASVYEFYTLDSWAHHESFCGGYPLNSTTWRACPRDVYG